MEFETEEQQIEAIKKWWKDYGPTIALGLVIGLAGVFGYRYYDSQQEVQLANASDAYEDVLVLLKEPNDHEKFMAAAAAFKSEHQDSIYNNLLSLQLAKLAVDADDLGTAAQHLRDTLNNAQHATIEHMVRIRLARILIAQEQLDEALTIIAGAIGDDYRSSYEMLRGDVWLAKGDRNRARQAYNSAKEKASDGPTHPSLDMLLDDLAGEVSVADVDIDSK